MQRIIPSAAIEEANHGDANEHSQGQALSEKKSKDKKIFSCHSCRRRKVKCDRSDPCGACHARGEGHLCTWEEGQRPEKKDLKNLETLPNLILKLTDEIRGLKTHYLEFVDKIRSHEGPVLSESFLAKLTRTAGTSPVLSGSGASSFDRLSDSLCQSPDREERNQYRTAALLPETPLLRGLIVQFLHTFAPLVGFIDVHQLVSELDDAEQVRNGIKRCGSPISLVDFNCKIALILSCASLAAINLDSAKVQEFGLSQANVEDFAIELWTKARSLVADIITGSFTSSPEASILTVPPVDSTLSIRIVAIKMVLLLAARSFASSSQYLKLHLDTLSSALEASLDSPMDDDMQLEERERWWQMWTFLCTLDWTSPGIYHNGNYFIRPDMYNDPPSKVPGIPDGTSLPVVPTERLETFSQTRRWLEYAIAVADLSRRAETCLSHSGPISPAKAVELCSELDVLDEKLSFYPLFSAGTGRGDLSSSGSSPILNECRVSLQRAPQLQCDCLKLELDLIRFKILRHETFGLIRDTTASGQIQLMCINACTDACILVLSHCRKIGMNALYTANQVSEGLHLPAVGVALDVGEKNHRCLTIRRFIQPGSSAALVGQILLNLSQSSNNLKLSNLDDNTSEPPSRVEIASWNSYSTKQVYEASSAKSCIPNHLKMGSGEHTKVGLLSPVKISILQLHINAMVTALETLQSTSSLARYKLSLLRQCIQN